MKESLSVLLRGGLSVETEADGLMELNRETDANGLELNREEALELARTHRRALADCGRVEIGSGTVEKIALALSRSRYLTQENYACAVEEAVEAFYGLKNESEDTISDDELVALLTDGFERYEGKLAAYLNSPELDCLLRTRRYGADETDGKEPEKEEDDPDE